MTTNRDDNPPRRIHRPGAPQTREQLDAQRYREGDELDPRDDRGQGSERSESQGRGNDPDRG